MSEETPIKEETPIETVGELVLWLKQFDVYLKLEITYDSEFGTGAGLSQERIYEKDGKLRIDIIS